MEKLFEKFMEDVDGFLSNMGLNEREICNDAFDAHARCECIFGGTEDYFDPAMEQWYPGEAPVYRVWGYEGYISDIAIRVAEAFAEHYFVHVSGKLIRLVRENLSDIFQDALLDEDAFRARAIDSYYN